MHDQINNPLDRAIYWVEYVIRHQGAPHLRNASRDLSFPQRALLDVILILATAISFAAFLIVRVGCFCYSKCGRKDVLIGTNKKVN